MVSCPEYICIHECRLRILVKNTENEVFQNQGIKCSHNFYIFAFYYQIKKTFNFPIRVTDSRLMCLTYCSVEAFQSCHITHSKSGSDQIWSDLKSSPLRTLICNGSTGEIKDKSTPSLCWDKWKIKGTCNRALQPRTWEETRQDKKRPSQDLWAGRGGVLEDREDQDKDIKDKLITLCPGWKNTGPVQCRKKLGHEQRSRSYHWICDTSCKPRTQVSTMEIRGTCKWN